MSNSQNFHSTTIFFLYIEKAVEVADKMSDNRVIEKLRYLTKDGGQTFTPFAWMK